MGAGRGFVLAPCSPQAAIGWARRGLGPVVVAPLDGWSVVVPAGYPRARAPYDDPVRTLAGRPVARRMRPALGFFHVGRQAVVTVNPARVWSPTRWLIWTPRDGAVPPQGLPPARPSDLAAAARDSAAGASAALGAGESRDVETRLREIFGSGASSAPQVLTEALRVLGLPGAPLLTGDLDPTTLAHARVVTPAPRHARAFDRLVADEQRYRTEMEA